MYSIGYGSRDFHEFVVLLKTHRINKVIDVRTRPYSTYKTEYNRANLKRSLNESGITYRFMGHLLGGLPDMEHVYVEGRVDYDILSKEASYQEGLKRLIQLYEEGHKMCIMCSEEKPEECHRSRLIGRSLAKENIHLKHILPHDGGLSSQEDVMQLITGGQQSLFDMGMVSNRRHQLQHPFGPQNITWYTTPTNRKGRRWSGNED